MNHIRIFPPGHPSGHPVEWFWELRSDNEIIDCGKANGLAYACEDAEDSYRKAEHE